MNFQDLKNRIQHGVSRLDSRQRILLLLGLSVLTGMGLWWGWIAREGEFVPLFSHLEPTDAARIVEALEGEGIAYRLGADGTTVLVPEDQVHRLRLRFAEEHVPGGGVVGMEILNDFRFGATEFERRMSFLRALQGELTRTIRQIEGVQDARVHIVMPEESLFVSQRRPATAAVLVRMDSGRALDPDQVRAVARLVSGSVEGLDPADVTVVDDRGNVLSAGLFSERDEEFAPGMSLQNLELQQRFQNQLQASLQSLLEQVFGPGNVVTRVQADLNFDQRWVESEWFEPADEDGLLRSVQELEESFQGSAAAQAGFPGTDSNVALPTVPIGGGDQDATYQRNERVQNFELNQIRERTVVAPGAVRRLSVSVVINDQLNEEQIQAVQSTVEAALGIDPLRDDRVSVIGMPFDTSVRDQLAESLVAEQEARERAAQRRVYGLVAAAVLLLIVLVWLTLVLRAARNRALEQEFERRFQAELEKRLRTRSDRTELPGRNGRDMLAKERPEKVAQVLRAWMAEEP